jgi:thiol-disulfide isomerase/thioredoxin
MKSYQTLLAIGVAALAATGFAKGPSAMMGKPVPAFSMTSMSGEKLSDKSLRGKVVVLDFWATWCGPCKMASPVMDRVQKKFGSKVKVIGANVFEENPNAARGYAKEHGYSYTMTLGNDKLATAWKIQGIPLIMVIGKDGKVAKVYEGYFDGLEADISGVVSRLAK